MEQAPTIHDITETQERTVRARFGSFVQKQGALVLLVLVCIIATARYEAFLTPENLLNVLRQNSMLGIIAVGMTFVILTGGIDLSVSGVVALIWSRGKHLAWLAFFIVAALVYFAFELAPA